MPHRPVKRDPDSSSRFREANEGTGGAFKAQNGRSPAFAEIESIAADEAACRALFERLRFPDGLRCAACGAAEAAGQSFTRHRSRPGLFTCCECRRQITLSSGTALHRTRLPLGQWLRAIRLVSASSKGMSARKLSELLGVTYKVAWHLGHRIRAMMTDESVALSGIVEVDEIYAGAPPRKPHGGTPSGVKSGRGPRRPLVLEDPAAAAPRSGDGHRAVNPLVRTAFGQYSLYEALRPPSALRCRPGQDPGAARGAARLSHRGTGVAADQWQRFNKTVSAEAEARSARLSRSKAIVGLQRMQMLRCQVVGQLESFIENRARDFRDAVLPSSVDEATRHRLPAFNKLRAWFRHGPLVMKATDAEIPDDVRHLARRIMHGMLARHRRPRFHRLNPWIDRRQAKIGKADTAAHAPLWVSIGGMQPETGKTGKPKKTQTTIKVPLKSYSLFEERGGEIARTVQLIERGADRGRPGELVIGVVSDMEEPFAASRAADRPLREELALDFGLSAMFATPHGDLLGRAWFDQLERHDDRIAGLARRLEKHGIHPNRSRRYRARVAAFRGFLQCVSGIITTRRVPNDVETLPGRSVARHWQGDGRTEAGPRQSRNLRAADAATRRLPRPTRTDR